MTLSDFRIEKFGVYLADLGSRAGTELGKIRPVVVIQSDLLNNVHPSTLVCPLTSRTAKGFTILRLNLTARESGLKQDSDILVDQIRAIDNKRFQSKIGMLSTAHQEHLLQNLRTIVLS